VRGHQIFYAMEIPLNFVKQCGQCSECCKGYLEGEAYGHRFSRGSPCHFHDNGCSIYEQRPHSPCKTYKCFWLNDSSFVLPLWLRPDKCGVIATVRHINDDKKSYTFLDLMETDRKMDSSVLSYYIQFCIKNNINLVYRIDNSPHYIGTQEFLKAYTGR